MSDMLSGFKSLVTNYKSVGGKFLKTTAIELFLDTYHDELVSRLADALTRISPEQIPLFVHGQEAIPIPDDFYQQLKGFEDYLESFEPGRIFEMISEANPLIAAAIMDLGDEGAEYMVKFKQYIVDRVKGAPEEEVEVEEHPEEQPAEEATPPPTRVRTKIAAAEPEAVEKKTEPEKTPPAKEPKMKHLTCSECGESWDATEEEAANTKECPFCHAPA